MKYVAVALAIMLNGIFARAATRNGVPTGEMIGYVQLNQKLSQRIFANPKFRLDGYIGDNFYSATALSRLLGSFLGDNSTYRNGEPGPLNFLIWQAMAERLTHDLSGICNNTPLRFAPSKPVASDLRHICEGGGNTQEFVKTLERIWLAAMRHDAPESEMKIWLKFLKSESASELPADQTVQTILFSMLMNPYFYLER